MISVTIALTRYNEHDELLQQCLESIAAQEGVRARVLVLDQKEHSETMNLCEILSSKNIIFEYHVIPARGCAHSRNIAIRFCQTDILLWTDPDMLLEPNWAKTLGSALRERNLTVVGGKILPHWSKSPSWYMKTNVMADHYSLIDLGPEDRETERIIGGSMGIHVGLLGGKSFLMSGSAEKTEHYWAVWTLNSVNVPFGKVLLFVTSAERRRYIRYRNPE